MHDQQGLYIRFPRSPWWEVHDPQSGYTLHTGNDQLRLLCMCTGVALPPVWCMHNALVSCTISCCMWECGPFPELCADNKSLYACTTCVYITGILFLLTFDTSRSTWFAELTPGSVTLTRTLRVGCLLSGSFTLTEWSGTHSLSLLLLRVCVRDPPQEAGAISLLVLWFCSAQEASCFAGLISSISLLLGRVEPFPLDEVVPFVRNIRGGRSLLSSDSDKWRARGWIKKKIGG